MESFAVFLAVDRGGVGVWAAALVCARVAVCWWVGGVGVGFDAVNVAFTAECAVKATFTALWAPWCHESGFRDV
ncbi:hypothetical protein GCM10027199_10070 [Amycolatopsis magusensis]